MTSKHTEELSFRLQKYNLTRTVCNLNFHKKRLNLSKLRNYSFPAVTATLHQTVGQGGQ